MGASTSPNWVGHLVMSRIKDSVILKVYDYAAGGHTLADVKRQVEVGFLPNVGIPEEGESKLWESEDTLFSKLIKALILNIFLCVCFTVTWVGINDCAYVLAHRNPD